jgi:hypothetical protein
MSRPGVVPAPIRRALASPEGRCYRHCDQPIRTLSLKSPLPGAWTVRACPSGVVSVTTYAEWGKRNPSTAVRAMLRRWARPAALVRSWDLRLASRHGPELGRSAERFLARARPPRPVRIVYWRVYPFRARDGGERRLFVCARRSHPTPVFFAADPTKGLAGCPECARRPGVGPRARRRSARGRR